MIKSFDIKNFKDKSSFEVSKIFKKNYMVNKIQCLVKNLGVMVKQNIQMKDCY
jgi:[protein-PII] uridylyltransferase